MALIDSVAGLATQVVRLYGYDEFLNLLRPRPTVDERITKLAAIQTDLEAAIEAVKILQKSASESKAEAEALQGTIARLQQDKQVAEELTRFLRRPSHDSSTRQVPRDVVAVFSKGSGSG
jgi:hypothetical protein